MNIKIKALMLAAFIAVPFSFLNAQNCESYFPIKTGATWEVKNYDAKDKLSGSTISKILKNEGTGNNISLTVSAESFDAKNVSQGIMEYIANCTNGVFAINMKSMLNAKTMEVYKDMDITVTGDDVEMPSNPSVGQSLKDANLAITVNGGMAMMNLTMKIYNRKVAAIETVTTPAGTFQNCIKITYDVTTNMMFKIETSGMDWYVKNIGMVKSESYDSKGKKLGYSLLTSITQ